jgi:hypothetical protein
MGDWRYSSTIQLHAPAALPPGKKPSVPIEIGWVGPRFGLDAVEKRKMLHCPESKPYYLYLKLLKVLKLDSQALVPYRGRLLSSRLCGNNLSHFTPSFIVARHGFIGAVKQLLCRTISCLTYCLINFIYIFIINCNWAYARWQ